MNCPYCGFLHEEPTDACERCGAELPDPTCNQCGKSVEWTEAVCDECEQMSRSADKTPCPSCEAMNDVSAEYCTECGTPMAVMTEVTELSGTRDRAPLDTWRVYGIETDLVDREEELATLHAVLEASLDRNEVQLVSVTGPTGVGKSRLLAEFEREAERDHEDVLCVRAASRRESTGPYGVFGRLLQQRYYIGEDDDRETARRKFVDAVETIVGEPRGERIARVVGHALGFPGAERPRERDTVEFDGESELDRETVEAFAELLRADAAETPLVLMLEDLQYAKKETLLLVDHLGRRLEDVPVSFVASWNPDEVFDDQLLESLPSEASVELRPLDDEHVADLVRQTLHRADEVPEALVEKVVDVAHGNPLSVEEMLRVLISDGVVDTRTSEWVVHVDRLEEVEWPTSIEETVRARLATLGSDEVEILEMAACIGRTFRRGAIRAVYHLQHDRDADAVDYWFDTSIDDQIDDLLEGLERKDMIRRVDEGDAPGEDTFKFKHRIERRSLYEETAGQLQQRYHRLVAQWLERRADDDARGRLLERIARHFDEGHCLDRAAEKYLEAAEHAADRYANQKAIDLYTRGLGYLSDADMALKMKAFHDLGNVYERRGEFDQALAYFREMRRYAWYLDAPGKGGAALSKIGRAHRGLGEYDEARKHLERALDLFWEASDLTGVASTLDDIGRIEWFRGDYEEALRYYSGGLELRREEGDERSIALSLSNLGSLELQRGALDEAMDYFREALELRQSIDHAPGVADSFNTLGALCLERDDVEDAVEFFEDALDIARDMRHRVLEAKYLNNLGEAHLKAGRLEQADDVLDGARDLADRAGEKRILFDALRNLGRLSVELGKFDRALDRVRRAVEIAEDLESESMLARARQTSGTVHARLAERDRDDAEQHVERADEAFREAVRIYEDIGNRANLGRCLSEWGEFLHARGNSVQGKKKLERAREIFDQLEIRKLREATEQAIHAI